MTHYRLDTAFLQRGWAHDVSVTVSPTGFITHVETGPPKPSAGAIPTEERIAGIVVPGMPNAHSHAFQRAMAGNTEYRLSATDSFWTWRQAMYSLANRLQPDELEIIATQLFIEMLKSGYTSVAEFHYLHRQQDGAAYAGDNPLWNAIVAAAHAAGIALTFLPTLYQTSDFGNQPLKREQSRFAFATDACLEAVERQISADHRERSSTRRTGAAFHSLRAVPPDQLKTAAAALRVIDADMPVHIHVAEQELEVESCLHATGRRPIELLLELGLLNPHWCLVHATHATELELAGIAAARAAVCVSISTEANLGDGFFDAAKFLSADGRLCIGSDSQSTVNPTEELRWLEYQQRLRKRRRGVLADDTQSHVGTSLWSRAAREGAIAIGQPAGEIAAGQRADWLVLDPQHASMLGAAPDTVLDHLVFAGGDGAIRDVMVGGRWVVRDRGHSAEASHHSKFAALMQHLQS